MKHACMFTTRQWKYKQTNITQRNLSTVS